jgi:NTP pyrophosphatase (non-canonical NTP hydrolase)
MQINDYQVWTRKLWSATPQVTVDYDSLHASLGLVTEASELADVYKKNLFYGRAFSPSKILDEAGDILYYVARILDANGFTLSDCLEANVSKLTARFGDSFDANKANNRDTVKENKAVQSYSAQAS